MNTEMQQYLERILRDDKSIIHCQPQTETDETYYPYWVDNLDAEQELEL